jgi:nicotinate-nucleotide pyrophosphorylase (carboxylating)
MSTESSDIRIVDPIEVALREDIGKGDVTSDFFVPAKMQAWAQIISREKATVAGTKTAAEVFRHVDPKLRTRIVRGEGSIVRRGETIIEIRGAVRSILKAERVALNFLQRLCGIATLTRKFVEAAGNRRVHILDTRKTTPGMRALEKAAVIAGGGKNHRFGLFDMVLVKDNHLLLRGGLHGIAGSVQRVRQARPGISIEIEADRLDQVRELLETADVDLILLDNMTPAQMRKAVTLRDAVGRDRSEPDGRRARRVKFEASGGITLKNIRRVAGTGVDYISIGALTHSAPAIDLSLELTDVRAA